MSIDDDVRVECLGHLATGGPATATAPVRQRSPQQKRQLSYARDRRNCYGENLKSSRKNIARGKRFPHRADRHGRIRLGIDDEPGARARIERARRRRGQQV